MSQEEEEDVIESKLEKESETSVESEWGEGGSLGKKEILSNVTVSFEDKVVREDEPGVITDQHLKEISHELGLIKLCWEDVPQVDFEGQLVYPLSYMQNSKKEKLLLWYAENFRQQFYSVYLSRRPILIACDNECGIQKMVCTTIRPTNMKFPEFDTWQGCASFVSEYLKYEELQNPTILPDRINSPQTVLKLQVGHSFEFTTLLASILIGSGYDAYVVSGYATREICRKDQTRVECPFLQDEPEEEEEEEEPDDAKYFLRKPVELKSQFLQEMEARELQKIRDAEIAQELAELEAIREFERPPPDELWGWRLHSWILILPSKDVSEPFFVESTTGIGKALDDPDYHGIECVWNHQNYFVLVQFDKKTETCADISFDLKDPNCWERLLVGEPITFREMPPELLEAEVEELNQACIEAEKHLDMPHSWVDKLLLSHSAYESRYPNARKVIFYRKAISEQFAPYSQSDGLVERVARFDDYECRQMRQIREKYANRADFMYFCERTLADDSVLEKFGRGREDGLKERFYYAMNAGVEDKSTLEFYPQARLDGLYKLETDPFYLTLHFVEREDFLYYFHVEFEERTSPELVMRNVIKMTEKYNRNPEKDADKDLMIVEYCLKENKMIMKFHYEPEHVTQTDRTFLKSSVPEGGLRISYDPKLTSGYLTGPVVPIPKPLYLYRLELEYFKREEFAEKKITCDRLEELQSLLRLRSQELAAPRFIITEFDIERNSAAREAVKEQEQEKLEMSQKEIKMSWDILEPYYAKLGLKVKTHLHQSTAVQVMEECLTDWKNLLVGRANEIQRKFEQSCQEFKEKNNWYTLNQNKLTKEQKDEYFDYFKRNSYYLHILEVRLNRHKEMAPVVFMDIKSSLRNDPRLASAFGKRKRHK